MSNSYFPVHNVSFTEHTFSGDGYTTDFDCPHDLGETPDIIMFTPRTQDASGNSFVVTNDTDATVCFIEAPPIGTDNIVINIIAITQPT